MTPPTTSRPLLLALAAAALFVTTSSAAESVDRSWPAARRGAVEVEVAAGTLRVVGTEARRIHLEGHRGADATLEVDHDGRWTRLRVVRPADATVGAALDLRSELTLSIPRGSDLEIRGQGLTVEVDAVDGRIAAETVAGDVRLRGTPRAVEITSVTGSLELEVETATVVARTVDGSVRLAGAVDEVSAETVDGTIGIDAAVASEARLTSVLGAVRVDGPLAPEARLVARTGSGSVDLRLPAGDGSGDAVGGTFVVTSQRGSFDGPLDGRSFDGGSGGPRRASYVVGTAPRRVEIETFDGPIRIHGDAAEPPPPSAEPSAESSAEPTPLASASPEP